MSLLVGSEGRWGSGALGLGCRGLPGLRISSVLKDFYKEIIVGNPKKEGLSAGCSVALTSLLERLAEHWVDVWGCCFPKPERKS